MSSGRQERGPAGRGATIRLLIAIGAPILAAFALLVLMRFGSADATEAATIVTGMLVFLLGIVALAFLLVLVFHLARLLRARDDDLISRIEASSKERDDR